MQTMNTELFKNKSKAIHNEYYDYSESIYKNARTKIKIICKKHGLFEQIPHQHLLGKGCYKCGKEKMGRTNSIDTKTFIEKAIKIHGNKYDYSKVVYKSNNEYVDIICKDHGTFKIVPRNHIGTHMSGCRKCASISTGLKNRKGFEQFLKEAIEVHGNTYNYKNVDFSTRSKKIQIECKEHGFFSQTPDSHISGHGCSKCAAKGFQRFKPAVLYFVYLKKYNLYKIGITGKEVESRLKNEDIEILYVKKYDIGIDALIDEQKFIRYNMNYIYDSKKLIKSGGSTELFDFSKKLGAPRDSEGKQLKPEGWEQFAPEPKLQALLDKRH